MINYGVNITHWEMHQDNFEYRNETLSWTGTNILNLANILNCCSDQ